MGVIQIKMPLYNEFVGLTKEQQNELNTVIKYAKPIEINCKAWKYGDVKTTQHLLTKEINFDIFNIIITFALGKYWHSKRYDIVMLSWKGIIKSISEISEFEAKAFKSRKIDTKLEAAIESVGGFEKFNRLPEIVKLMEYCNCKYNEAYDMDWNTANAIQWYKHTLNEVQKEYNEQ